MRVRFHRIEHVAGKTAHEPVRGFRGRVRTYAMDGKIRLAVYDQVKRRNVPFHLMEPR